MDLDHCRRVLLILLFSCSITLAKDPACQVDIPVSVVLPSGGVVNRLSAAAFVAHSKDEPNIQSVNPDDGPRRILFVVETGKQNRPVVREIDAAVISHILAHARAQDSFALLTTYTPVKEVKFGMSRAALLTAADEAKKAPEGKNPENGVLDAIADGTTWFQPPQSGDAIIVLTMGIEGEHRARYSRVRDDLVDNGIRLFGFQFGDGARANPGGRSVDTGGKRPSQVTSPEFSPAPNRESLLFLTRESGGVAIKEKTSGDDYHRYDLTEQRLQHLLYAGLQEYKAVVESYRMTIKLPARNFALDLTDSAREAVPTAMLLFPIHLPKCPGESK